MAMPTSAVARAGASLIPSPIMATLPRVFSSSTMRALSWGKIPACTSAMPSWAPMASAVTGLSPVSITVRTPRALNASNAALEVGLSTSAHPNKPRRFSPSVIYSSVFPAFARSVARSVSGETSTPFSTSNAAFPARQSLPALRADTPLPGTEIKSVRTTG
ncbi:hypothetical protein SDC9_198143 [bioreactor metagenome]|uniref:Uncharacterized protein n=1 Tax=bioreactor metagenome TaxID=1076179 RepID=A0A645IHP4_9ZZZZ